MELIGIDYGSGIHVMKGGKAGAGTCAGSLATRDVCL